MGGSFFIGIGEGIEALAKPIFVRGVSPFYGWRTLRPNLSCGRFVFCWEWGGDRSIGGANLRKGAALLWKCASHPSMAGTPRAWPAHLATLYRDERITLFVFS